MPGYSKRSLLEKLGIRAGASVLLVGAPAGYADTLGPLPAGAKLCRGTSSPCDFIQVFADRRVDLERRFPKLAARLTPAGMLWVSWPKKASGVATDVTEGAVREVGLANGLVDVKVAAVTDVWSGLKFVRRLRDRG